MSYAVAHRSNKSKTGESKKISPRAKQFSTSQHPINNYSAIDSPDSLLHLQRSIGNQAVQRLIRSSNAVSGGGFNFQKIRILQPKLKVSQSSKACEQEADKVAEQVMRMSVSDSADPMTTKKEGLDRKCSACEMKNDEEEEITEISRKLSVNPARKQVINSQMKLTTFVLAAALHLMQVREDSWNQGLATISVKSKYIQMKRLLGHLIQLMR
jgi:hypothetical protein